MLELLPGGNASRGAEISILLGFDDPNAFFRAFHAWTGHTPEQARAMLGSTAN